MDARVKHHKPKNHTKGDVERLGPDFTLITDEQDGNDDSCSDEVWPGQAVAVEKSDNDDSTEVIGNGKRCQEYLETHGHTLTEHGKHAE